MSTHVKRVEKDFLLKVLYDDQIPILYNKEKTEYTLTVEKHTGEQLFFKSDRPIKEMKIHKKLDLKFNFHGQIMLFTVDVIDYKGNRIITLEPECLYRNLDRSYSRVLIPMDIEVKLSFSGDQYSLSYPRTRGKNILIGKEELDKTLASESLSELVNQMESGIKSYATGYKLVIFKDGKPSATEEQIMVETGKALFIPSTAEKIPNHDPSHRNNIITEDLFKQYLLNTGASLKHLDEACAHFIERIKKTDITSALWVPILFQEYVIGYIHMWIKKGKKEPFNYDVIENIFQFSEVLSYSLELNGYFEAGKLKSESFDGDIIDISVSGLLFAYPNSSFTSRLKLEDKLSVKIITKHRSIDTKAKIVRYYEDRIQKYYGCCFLDMKPEDTRFLFEYIYGKTFTDEDAIFFTGQV